MTLVTPPSGPDFDVTDYEALAYYRREPGYVVHDGLSAPASPAPVVPTWAAATSYTAGQVVQHPTSPDLFLRRIATGVSRSSFDATEQATWKATGSAAYLQLSQGGSVVWLGDSLMSGQGNDPIGGGQWGLSMPTYATYLSKGALRRVRQAGIPGNTSAQILARFDTDVTPYAPGMVVIMAGTNDTNDASPVPIATYAANMVALIQKCRTIAATPVLCTLPPNNVSSARRKLTINYNAWMRRYCKDHGIVLVDLYNLFVDPATGDYLAAYGSASNDHTHPIGPGWAAMGPAFWNAVSSLFPAPSALLPGENTDGNNLLTNGLFLTTTGSGTSLMPTGWSVQSGAHPSGVTGSLVTGDATIKGNWWRLVADGTAAATDNEFQTVSGIVPGHTYAHVGRFKATGMRNADTGNGSTFLIGTAFNSTLNNPAYDFRVASTHAFDVAEGVFHQEIVAPSDASTALVRCQLLNAVSGAGTFQVAQLGLYDLTAMGLA